jgi:hypothetical protein
MKRAGTRHFLTMLMGLRSKMLYFASFSMELATILSPTDVINPGICYKSSANSSARSGKDENGESNTTPYMEGSLAQYKRLATDPILLPHKAVK